MIRWGDPHDAMQGSAIAYADIFHRHARHKLVMPGLVPGIHVLCAARKVVDGRDKPGHDDVERLYETPRSYAIALHSAGRMTRIFGCVAGSAVALTGLSLA